MTSATLHADDQVTFSPPGGRVFVLVSECVSVFEFVFEGGRRARERRSTRGLPGKVRRLVRHASALVALLLVMGASARARTQPGAPPPPAAPAAPTDADIAPIAIPTGAAPSSDFARRLGLACGSLHGSGAPPAATRQFQVAPLGAVEPAGARRAIAALPAPARDALAGLRATCDRVDSGDRLDAGDLDNLRAFRQNAALAQERIAQIVNAAAALPQAPPPLTFTSSGSLEADVIAGLATFIYDRAKQEAILYLGRELGQRLCTDVNRLFFPDLCLAIGDSDPPMSLAAMGSYLAIAARRDLGALPDRVLAYQLHALSPAAPPAARESLVGARLGLAYFRAVAGGRTPLDAARSLHRLPPTTPGANTVVFGATARASELLDAVAAQVGWSDLGSATDSVARRYALGVLFSLGDLFRDDGLSVPAPDPDQIAALVPLVARYLAEAKSLSDRAQHALASLRHPTAGAGSERGDFAPSDGGGGGGSGGGGGDDGGGGSVLGTLDYVVAATQTLQSTLQSGVAVAHKLGVLTPAAAATVARLTQAVDLGEQMVAGKSPSELVIAGLDLLRQLGQQQGGAEAADAARIITDLKTVIVLMSQVAQADSADEVAKVLEAAAAPIATYETKYQHPVVALGALVGASTGVETLRTNGAGWSTGWVAGAFAPVGITASTPLARKWHCGALLSVINLGGLVSTRFSEDTRQSASGATQTVKADPAVKLANVFAPGLWFTLGIYGSPLSFSLGGQVVPQGREVVDMTGASSRIATLQLMGSLALDVPILTF